MAMRRRLGYGPAAKESGMKTIPAAAMLACVMLLGAGAARAENAPGVTATEIKLGQTMSYSGPVAEIGRPLGESEQAYFRMIDDQGGVNGRKIVLESLDDGFDAQKALALTKKMIEQDHVAAIFGAFATPQNVAIEPYLNAHGIPDLFIATGDDWVINPKKYPWTIGGVPVFRIEAQIFGRYILVNMAGKKVGLLRSRDQMGDSYRTGLGQGLGAQYYQMIAKDETVDDRTTDIDPEWQALRSADVQAVVVAAPPTIVARAIAKAHDGDWHPQLFINFASSSPSVLALAGLDKATGIITANSYLDTGQPQWADSPIAKPFNDFVAHYLPSREWKNAGYFLAGYVSAQAMVQVLKQCGDDLSRLNIMRQAANLKDFHPVGLIPGITFFTSRSKYLPIVEAAMQRWDGRHWVQVGEVMAGF
jgi:branched-chain amino acid transport system substrate-binding protein